MAHPKVMDGLALRVARRFRAETLTKPWLMAVRRGWVSLMKPPVQDYGDVFKAFDKLLEFTKNLRDQVLNVRRGPYTSAPSMMDRGKMEDAFETLQRHIKDAAGTAKHWYESYEGIGLAGNQPGARRDGEHMLDLYKRDFDGATSFDKTSRGKNRKASLTELLGDILKILYVDAERIKDHDEKNPGVQLDIKEEVFKEFQIGGATVVVLDQKTNGAAIERYIPLLKKAYQDLKRWGFGSLWYGALLITLGDFEKLPPWLKEEYEKAGYAGMDGRAGTYHSGEDVVKLTAPPTDYFVTTVIHEMGHRYWFKFMNAAKRAKFEMLVEGTYTRTHAVLLNRHKLTDDDQVLIERAYAKLEAGREPSVEEKKLIDEKYNELGIKAGIPLVSNYSKSSIAEAFAEVFERYVSGANLTRPQMESFRSVIASFDPWKVTTPLIANPWV